MLLPQMLDSSFGPIAVLHDAAAQRIAFPRLPLRIHCLGRSLGISQAMTKLQGVCFLWLLSERNVMEQDLAVTARAVST